MIHQIFGKNSVTQRNRFSRSRKRWELTIHSFKVFTIWSETYQSLNFCWPVLKLLTLFDIDLLHARFWEISTTEAQWSRKDESAAPEGDRQQGPHHQPAESCKHHPVITYNHREREMFTEIVMWLEYFLFLLKQERSSESKSDENLLLYQKTCKGFFCLLTSA